MEPLCLVTGSSWRENGGETAGKWRGDDGPCTLQQNGVIVTQLQNLQLYLHWN